MGVHRSCRRQGIGLALIEHAQRWAAGTAPLEWIDLQVLGGNESARALYRAAGFTQVGEIPRMFRVDGEDFSYVTMIWAVPETDRQA